LNFERPALRQREKAEETRRLQELAKESKENNDDNGALSKKRDLSSIWGQVLGKVPQKEN
jgi:hypothetical protein